jgi:hypothetical protein
MKRLGGGRVPTPHNDEFFFWWRRWVISIDNYSYDGINYKGDPYIPFPPGSTYDDIGKKCFLYISFFLCLSKRIKNTNIFVWYQVLIISLSCICRSAKTRRIPTTSMKEPGR